MKIGRILTIFFVIGCLIIVFGDRGLIDNYKMYQYFLSLKEENQKLSLQNNQLKMIIALLKDDLTYMEMVARKDLGMVKKGELVYRFLP